jgi:hypothetical protein
MTDCFDSPMADRLYEPSLNKGRIPPRWLEGEWEEKVDNTALSQY